MTRRSSRAPFCARARPEGLGRDRGASRETHSLQGLLDRAHSKAKKRKSETRARWLASLALFRGRRLGFLDFDFASLLGDGKRLQLAPVALRARGKAPLLASFGHKASHLHQIQACLHLALPRIQILAF